MKNSKIRLCIAGNLIGRNSGNITTQGQVVADLFSGDGYDVVSVSSKRNKFLRLLEIVWTIFRERKRIDVLIVEVYSGLAFILADVTSLVATLLRVPSVFVLHGGNLPDFTKRHTNWVRRVLERADFLVAPSRFLAREMEAHGFCVRIIPNVIELGTYPNKLRRRISPKLFWMRSFHSIYNPAMAVDVFSLIKADYPAASLVMAGVDKGLESEIKSKVSVLGLNDSIRFPGFLDHAGKIREFANADVYLNTNRIDNMPVSVLEAWAMGVPVVATNVGGLPYLIETDKTGLLVSDGNVEEMANAVKSLLKDQDLTERISAHGRLQAELSAWSCVRTNWEQVFEQIIPARVLGQGQQS